MDEIIGAGASFRRLVLFRPRIRVEVLFPARIATNEQISPLFVAVIVRDLPEPAADCEQLVAQFMGVPFTKVIVDCAWPAADDVGLVLADLGEPRGGRLSASCGGWCRELVSKEVGMTETPDLMSGMASSSRLNPWRNICALFVAPESGVVPFSG